MLALLPLLACVADVPDDARTAWIRDVLTRDNAPWLSRDPDLLAAKYARMADDPYDFMRGSLSLFLADASAPHAERATTAFLDAPEAAAVLHAGDPHPENVSTMLPGADATRSPVLELVDLDGAAFGPWTVDVRRGALGLFALVNGASACDDDCRTSVVTRFAQAYATRMLAEAPRDAVRCDAPTLPSAAFNLCALATDDTQVHRAREARTILTGGTRRWRLDAALDEDGRGLLAVTPEERAQVDRLLARWSARPRGFRVLDVARRYGMGVASLPAVRYALLFDLGEESPDDDAMLFLREVVDPPAPPGRLPSVPLLFDTNAARAEQAAHLLWSTPDADPWMAGVDDGTMTFKVVGWTDRQQGFEHDDFVDADVPRLQGLAEVVGQLLAATHARGLTVNGAPAAEVVRADLIGREADMVEELVSGSASDLARLLSDHARFVAALEAHGPLLGADIPTDDVPR